MEKLNEYLQTLLSTCSYELRLEPNKNPYIVNSAGNSDVTNTPLPGTQIGVMIFPLIPPEIKQNLPNQKEIDFVHPHRLGDFKFHIVKSPNGFIVSVKPIVSPIKLDAYDCDEDINQSFSPNAPVPTVGKIQPQIEVVSVFDPEFQTVFSDQSTYEPPIKKSEFAPVTVNQTINGESKIRPNDNNLMSQPNNNLPSMPINNAGTPNAPRTQPTIAPVQPPRAAVQPSNRMPRTMPQQ